MVERSKRNILKILFVSIIMCLSFSIVLVGCGCEKSAGSISIVIETDKTEFALEIGSEYTLPIAGVYDSNLDRVDGKEVRMSVINPKGDYVIENTLDNETLRFYTAGKYLIYYKADGVSDEVITIHVCRRLEMPSEFDVDISNNTITWKKVNGASGYTVCVNGDNEISVTTESYTSTVFSGQGYYVGVTAKGDNINYIDSYMGSYVCRKELGDNEIAAFDNPCYELDIVTATPSANPDPSEIKWLSQENCVGSNGGALKFLAKSGGYRYSNFRLDLGKTLDLSEISGIEVRFKLDSSSYQDDDSNTPPCLIIMQTDANSNAYSRGMMLPRDYNDSWQIMKLPLSVIRNYDGLDYLQFNLYNMVASSGKGYLYLDYVRLYKDELETPEVEISDSKIQWNGIEGAADYALIVDKYDIENDKFVSKYYYTDNTEINFGELGITNGTLFNVKVLARSDTDGTASSEWSEIITNRTEENRYVSSLSNELYKNDISEPIVNRYGTNIKVGLIRRSRYVLDPSADGGKSLRLVLYNEANTNPAFKINLINALDLSDEDAGIRVRFKFESAQYEHTDDLALQLVGNTDYSQNYGTRLFSQTGEIGRWTDLCLSTEELKTYYQDGDTALCFAVSTAENKQFKEVILLIDYIDYCKSLSVPQNVRVADNKLVWSAVDEAKGYTVSINEEEFFTTETFYDLSSYKDVLLKVRTETDKDGYMYSKYSDQVFSLDLRENELLTFNSEIYTNTVEYIDGMRASANAWKVAPSYDNGTVKFAVFLNNYDTASSSYSSALSAFKVKLSKGLDLTKSGITIRLQVYDMSTALELSSLSVLSKGGNATWCTSGESTYPNTSLTYQEWAEMIVTSAQLTEMGYSAGDTELYFGVWCSAGVNVVMGYNVRVQLDYIEYADIEILDAPTNLAVSDAGVITWDAVANADGYTVNINGSVYNVNTNSYTIDDPTSVSYATVKVKAVSDSALYGDSVWTDAVSAYVFAENELANFNNAQYTTNVEYITGNRWSNWRTAPSYDNGTVKFGLYLDNYNTASNAGSPLAAVKVVLPKGLDLTQDGITIRFQVYDKSAALTPSSFSVLEKGGNATWGTSGVTAYPNVSVTYQEWAELTVTSAQLTAMGYSAGDTELYLGVWLTQPMQITVSYGLWLQLDYIEYSI